MFGIPDTRNSIPCIRSDGQDRIVRMGRSIRTNDSVGMGDRHPGRRKGTETLPQRLSRVRGGYMKPRAIAVMATLFAALFVAAGSQTPRAEDDVALLKQAQSLFKPLPRQWALRTCPPRRPA